MATFLSLPNELKLQIIEETAPDGIENFALSCKLIYILAEKTLRQHKADKEAYDNIGFDFLWTGSHSRELSQYQKVLVLSESQRLRRYPRFVRMLSRSNGISRGKRIREFERDVRRVCDGILKNVDSPYMDKSEMKILLNKMVAGDVGAANSMLLTLLPNVERIHLSEYNRHDSGMIDMLFNISATNEKASSWMQEKLSLVKLKEVTIQWKLPNSGTEIGTLEAFMVLPSLRVVRACDLTGNYAFSDELCPDRCSNVTELHFRDCTLAVTDLARLFKHLKALRVFSYEHFQSRQDPTKEYGAGALINELYTHAGNSLTYLHYTNALVHLSSGDARVIQPGTLSKFTALKTLRISPTTMLNENYLPQQLINHLPPSLEELEISGVLSGDQATMMFYGMLSSKQTLLPKLQLIIFDSVIPFDDETIAAYERAGVVLDQRDWRTNMLQKIASVGLRVSASHDLAEIAGNS